MREDVFLNEEKSKNLNINISLENLEHNERTKKFVEELTEVLERFNNIENTKLTHDEEMCFYKEKEAFMQDFFKKELANTEKGEIFIVTDKYENDTELHRYKITQYKNNAEYKYVRFEKDLPEDVKINDIIRKVEEKYIYDEEATIYVRETLRNIKKEIIKNRK